MYKNVVPEKKKKTILEIEIQMVFVLVINTIA